MDFNVEGGKRGGGNGSERGRELCIFEYSCFMQGSNIHHLEYSVPKGTTPACIFKSGLALVL